MNLSSLQLMSAVLRTLPLCDSYVLPMLSGMAADPVAAARIKRSGLGIIPPALGLAAMSMFLAAATFPALRLSVRVAAAVPVDWNRLLESAGDAVPHFFGEFKPQVRPRLATRKFPLSGKDPRSSPPVRQVDLCFNTAFALDPD